MVRNSWDILNAILGQKYYQSSKQSYEESKPKICNRKWVLIVIFVSFCVCITVCSFQTFDLIILSLATMLPDIDEIVDLVVTKDSPIYRL